jgi:hypothetical protein
MGGEGGAGEGGDGADDDVVEDWKGEEDAAGVRALQGVDAHMGAEEKGQVGGRKGREEGGREGGREGARNREGGRIREGGRENERKEVWRGSGGESDIHQHDVLPHLTYLFSFFFYTCRVTRSQIYPNTLESLILLMSTRSSLRLPFLPLFSFFSPRSQACPHTTG